MKILTIIALLLAGGAIITTACSRKSSNTPGNDAPVDTAATTLAHPEWAKNAVIYEVNLRQYTPEGTINAFSHHLSRLRDLGVDLLWFMPVNPISKEGRKGSLGSYYAVADYKAINPEFGTLDDFKALVAKAHDMGFKVIIDWVPNHTGRDNRWLTEHPDWFVRDDKGHPVPPNPDWHDVLKLDYSNPAMRDGMIDAMAFWLRETGIDGFRCDVAGDVPTDFWEQARPQLDSISTRPLFMLAEAAKPELQRHAFDMGYNWPQKDLFDAIAATSGCRTREGADRYPARTAADIDSLLDIQAKQYPHGTIMMNMTTNHDLNSWEGTEQERLGNLADAMTVLTYTLPGMPLIYTGQEAGLNRALKFFDKDQAPQWEPRDDARFSFFQKLNHLKHTHPALHAGHDAAPVVRYPTSSPDLYVFSRTAPHTGATIYVLVNLGSKTHALNFTGAIPPVDNTTVDLFTAHSADLPSHLAPGAYRILITR